MAISVGSIVAWHTAASREYRYGTAVTVHPLVVKIETNGRIRSIHSNWVEEAYCVTDIGFNAECGDPAVAIRDGFPVCQVHANRWDYFNSLSNEEN